MADVRSGFARAADGIQLYWRSVGEGPPMHRGLPRCKSCTLVRFCGQFLHDTDGVVAWDASLGMGSLDQYIYLIMKRLALLE